MVINFYVYKHNITMVIGNCSDVGPETAILATSSRNL